MVCAPVPLCAPGMGSSSMRETVKRPVGGRLGEEEELDALLLLGAPAAEELELLWAPALEELELASGSIAELELVVPVEEEADPAAGSALEELLPVGETLALELLSWVAEVELELGAPSRTELEELDCCGNAPVWSVGGTSDSEAVQTPHAGGYGGKGG